jgi:hypothetical protein
MSAPSAPFFPTGPSSCWRRRVRRIARVGTVVGLLLLLPACSHTRKTKLDDVGLSYTPRNIGGVARWPAEVQRVAVLPVADATGSLPTTFVTSYDPTWLNALQHTQRAEFVAVDRAAYSRWTNHPRALVSTALLPADWASRIIQATGADAALLLDITHCSPYPPLSLGLRAKLVDLRTGNVLWATDEVFDVNNPDVARGARRHARAGQLGREGDAVSALQSPSRFALYAADTLVQSLPPR